MREIIHREFGRLRDDLITPRNAFELARHRFKSHSEWAAKMAGTTDRKSKPYKAALRSVQRWTTQSKERRIPNAKTLERLANLLRKDDYAVDQMARGVTIEVLGEFLVSSERRARSVRFSLEKQEVAAIMKALDDPTDLAYRLLWMAYGFVPDQVMNAQLRIN